VEIYIFAVFNFPDMLRTHLEIAFQMIKQNIDHELIPFLYHLNQRDIHTVFPCWYTNLNQRKLEKQSRKLHNKWWF